MRVPLGFLATVGRWLVAKAKGMMSESTARWLAGFMLAIATTMGGILWHAAQLDAKVNENATDIYSINVVINEVRLALQGVTSRLDRAETRQEISDKALERRLDRIEGKLDRADTRRMD